MNFSQRLTQLRDESGLNTLKFSERFGLSDSLVGAYLSGSKLPNLKNVLRLADGLGISVDYLLGRSDVREMSKKNEPARNVSEQAIELLDFFDKLSEYDKGKVVGLAQALAAEAEKKGVESLSPASNEKAV